MTPSRDDSSRQSRDVSDLVATVKVGVCSANAGPYATREALTELAQLTESLAIESIWVSDHVVVPDPSEPPSRMDPENPILDPVAALAFLAGRTQSVLLGSGVIVLPLREPLVLAKQLATVDVLSGGRLIFGLGVGYIPREFESVGVPFQRRGQRAEEYLAAMRTIWGEGRASFDGDAVSFAGVRARPRPTQRPGPRVVMGGSAPAVMRRTVREAHGWYGWGFDLDATADQLEALRTAAASVRRPKDLGRLEITITPPDDIDGETAKRYADLGVDRLNLQLPWMLAPSDLERWFGDVVAPLLEGAGHHLPDPHGKENA